jgi:ferrous iron transport protein B
MPTHKMAYSRKPILIDYGRELEHEISKLQQIIEEIPQLDAGYHPRWLAIKLLEQDSNVVARLQLISAVDGLLAETSQSVSHLKQVYGDDVDIIIADQRYGWIHGLIKESVQRIPRSRLSRSDKVDQIVLHPVLGIPIFLALMWVVFKVTTDVASPFLDWIDSVISGPVTRWVTAILGSIGWSNTWVESLFVDGVIPGVGGVLVFVPILMSLYMALAVLEDSGYMARAAFVMDRLMHNLGLHGKSFLPMILGFGCTVPALYATRTLESEKDRVLTGLLVPFMSCGARLPVYVLFAAIFFPNYTGLVVFAIYLIGVATAIILGIILRYTLFRGKELSPLVMELPPYRMPTLKGIWFHTWEHTTAFIRKAGTIIMAASIVLWVFMAIPAKGEGTFANTEMAHSAFATLAKGVSPALVPAGFGSWEASSSLVTGLIAKEVVVSTLAQVYNVDETDVVAEEIQPTTFFEDVREIVTGFVGATIDTLKSIPLIVGINLSEEDTQAESTGLMIAVRRGFEATSDGHGTLAAAAYMLFVLLYTPCIAALTAERQELGNRWMWFTVFAQLLLAWTVAVAVFQGGKLMGLG